MKIKIAAVFVAATMMAGCQTSSSAQNFPLGPVLGGVAGGFVGNQFGKGTGNTVATALGAVGGVLLGQQLQQPVQQPQYTQAPTYGIVSSCDAYHNAGARASCRRGAANRARQAQVQAEKKAYACGMYGRCY